MNNCKSFLEYGLSPEISRALVLLGYQVPTPIQQEAIPQILAGEDVVGKANTGTGKTAAFAIPLCELTLWEENEPQTLILEPTRELAQQVGDEITQIGRLKRIKAPVIFGGMPIDRQAFTLKQKSHIVIGTPGRILDHLRRQTLHLDKIKHVVIDEADLMLDMGFLEDVELILKSMGQKPQMLLFSATLGPHLKKLVDSYMEHPKRIEIASDLKTADGLTQIAYEVENEEKFELLMQLLIRDNPKNAMIFCDTREMVCTLYDKLKRKKVRCGMLHGGMEQRERLYAIGDFRKGKFHYLVTTDVAARGIDFDEITHVYNYDFPTKKENYVHRIGRSARKENTGTAVSFVTEQEKHYKEAVENYIGTEIAWGTCERDDTQKEKKAVFLKRQKEKIVLKEGKEAAFKEEIVKLSIGGGKKSKMRPGDIVGTICSMDGMTQEDIGVIDVRDSMTYVEILNGKGSFVFESLQEKPIKGKIRKVKKTH